MCIYSSFTGEGSLVHSHIGCQKQKQNKSKKKTKTKQKIYKGGDYNSFSVYKGL